MTDAYSKRIMGYEVCTNLEAASTRKALQMAIAKRQYRDQTLIHHSDRGLQYSSKEYIQAASGIQISMTQTGSPYDNAVAERINGILKDEFGLADKLDGLDQARRCVHQSIELYNCLRPHSSSGMLTPEQMHQQQHIQIKTYKRTPAMLNDG